MIDLETKLRATKDYKCGTSVIVFAHQSGMLHFTIATISKSKNKVTKAVKRSASLKAMKLTKIREASIADMEKLLTIWIEDQTRKCNLFSTTTFTTKSKSLFAMLKEKAEPGYDVQFNASSRWSK